MHPDQPSAAASIHIEHWGYRHASRAQFAVRDITLHIPAGQRVLLLGSSGVGKSTLLHGIAGIVPSSQGDHDDDDEAFVEGRMLIDQRPAHRSRDAVGLVLQDPDAQVVAERVGDNVAFGPENFCVPPEQIWSRVRESLDAVGLQDFTLERSTSQASGGQLQRLALASVLAMRPKVLLLDEPTANVDPQGAHQVVEAVSKVLERTGATMVLVEHRVDQWIDLIDRVVVLAQTDHEGAQHEGSRAASIMFDGTPDEIFGQHGALLDSLGVWVPKRYHSQMAHDIKRLPHTALSSAADGTLGSTLHCIADRTSCSHQVLDDPGQGEESLREPVLRTLDVSIGRDRVSIADHIACAIVPGSINALVGSNGAGKSTLALTLAGLLKPVAGQVLASTELTAGLPTREPIAWTSRQLTERIAYVFQNPEHQFATSTVLQEVMLSAVRSGVDESAARARGEQLLADFGLLDLAQVNPYTLSGGQKRRLSVASALSCSPGVIILDEPTFGQDRNTWRRMVALIEELAQEGRTILLVTHDEDLIEALNARVIRLSEPVEAVAQDVRGDSAGDFARDLTDNVAEDVAEDSTEDFSDNSTNDSMESITVRASCERPSVVTATSPSPVLASMNPLMRCCAAILASLPLIVSLDVVSAGVSMVLTLIAFACIGLSPMQVLRLSWPVMIGAPGSALTVALYGKSGGHVFWQFALMQVSERSLYLAAATGLRIVAIAMPAIVLVFGIDATALADALSQKLKLNHRFVYGALAAMRLLNVLQRDWLALAASRRSRGLGEENKFKSAFSQAFALLVLSIRRSTLLATAMEVRGFGAYPERTYARVSVIRRADVWLVLVSVAIPVMALICAAATGYFAFFGG